MRHQGKGKGKENGSPIKPNRDSDSVCKTACGRAVRGHERGGEGGTSEVARARERRCGVGEGAGSGRLETAGSRGCVHVRVCMRRRKAGEGRRPREGQA